jgi:hypothetical protein
MQGQIWTPEIVRPHPVIVSRALQRLRQDPRWARIRDPRVDRALYCTVSYRSKSTGVNTTTTGNSTDTEPSGAVSGDALIAYCLFASGSSTAANAAHPSGWTLLYSVTQGAFKCNVAYIIRGGSAPTLQWTTAGSSIYREIQILCLTGAASITLDAQSAAGTTGLSIHTPNPPAVTAIASTSLAVCGGMNFAGYTGVAGPTGYTFRTDTTNGLYDGGMATKSLAASGSEDPAAFGGTWANSSDWWDGFTVTFTDETAGGGAPAVVARFQSRPFPFAPGSPRYR